MKALAENVLGRFPGRGTRSFHLTRWPSPGEQTAAPEESERMNLFSTLVMVGPSLSAVLSAGLPFRLPALRQTSIPSCVARNKPRDGNRLFPNLIGTILLLGALCSVGLGQSTQRGSVDWILVLDTSASMHGAGGTANIFSRVQTTIAEFIRQAREGDSIALYTFDRDTALRSNIRITSDIDKNDLIKTVNQLLSSGDRTYTGKALHDALERAAELNRRPDAAQRTVSIVLFTDGLEDTRGIPNPITIPSNISVIPEKLPYIFFVSLGAQDNHEPQLDNFVRDSGKGEVIRDPGANQIVEVGDRIRKKIESPPPPKEAKLSVEPSALDFGQIEPGERTGQQTLKIHSDADLRVRLSLDKGANGTITLFEPSDSVEIQAGKDASVKVQLQSVSQIQNGTQSMRLVMTPEASAQVRAAPVNVNATITIVRIPLWRKAIKWIVLALSLAILALVVASAVKGEPPWIWFPGLIGRFKPSLEGEIEVIHPRPARIEDGFISLTQRQARSVLLSTLLTNTNTVESDAELVAINKNGEALVELRQVTGVVQVNQVEVSSTSIYDGDIIEIGDAKLRFNWTGHEHPADVARDEF